MIFVVLEEVYSLAPDGSERELVRQSKRPLFAMIDWLHTGSQKSGRRNSTMLILKPTSVTRTFQVGTQRSKREPLCC